MMMDTILKISFRRERIRLIASVESALGIMNIREIATADPRLDALIVSRQYSHSRCIMD